MIIQDKDKNKYKDKNKDKDKNNDLSFLSVISHPHMSLGMVCPACVVPASAVALSVCAAIGIDPSDKRVQVGTPTIAGLACFGAIRLKNGAWRLGGCKRVRMAAICGAGLFSLGGCRFFFDI
jgi:hypothetical protein